MHNQHKTLRNLMKVSHLAASSGQNHVRFLYTMRDERARIAGEEGSLEILPGHDATPIAQLVGFVGSPAPGFHDALVVAESLDLYVFCRTLLGEDVPGLEESEVCFD